MPELPEVETYVRDLESLLAGRMVMTTEVRWPSTIAEPDSSLFPQRMRGRCFVSFGRRGKYILLGLDNRETLVVHLRMTGELRVLAADVPVDKHTHVLFTLESGGILRYRDIRKFGRMWLVEDPDAIVGKLGPEPLSNDFSMDLLAQRLAGRKATIKGLLLNQAVVAGIGNIYADEALFRAQIHPRRAGGDLTKAEISRLWQAVRAVLQAGIDGRGSSLQDYAPPSGGKGIFQEQHQVFRRSGEPCSQCGAAIRRMVLSQRSTHFCPVCQK